MLTDIKLEEASAIAQINYDNKYNTMYAYFVLPKMDEQITTTNSIILLHSYGLYHTKIGATAYPYCIELICHKADERLLEFYCARSMSSVGTYSNWQQRTSPQNTTDLQFKCKSAIELPAGTILKVWGRV